MKRPKYLYRYDFYGNRLDRHKIDPKLGIMDRVTQGDLEGLWTWENGTYAYLNGWPTRAEAIAEGKRRIRKAIKDLQKNLRELK